ncbi:MAG: RnfABCDGE type electron transport complex subunit G [Fusobacteriaceae bacterium]|nr:RnfABCDGE type electron transport complex subunit G [Fusobacteriaceae bacterium]
MENKFVRYGVVLLVIAAACAGSLAVVNRFTREVIKQNDLIVQNEARQKAMLTATAFKPDETKKVSDADGELEFIPAFEGDKQIGYVTTVTSKGYNGDIVFMLGVGMDGKVTGLSVVSNSETPGLGARVSEGPWQDHWKGVDASYTFKKTTDAFAGATISPTAVYNGIIRALTLFNKEVK